MKPLLPNNSNCRELLLSDEHLIAPYKLGSREIKERSTKRLRKAVRELPDISDHDRKVPCLTVNSQFVLALIQNIKADIVIALTHEDVDYELRISPLSLTHRRRKLHAGNVAVLTLSKDAPLYRQRTRTVEDAASKTRTKERFFEPVMHKEWSEKDANGNHQLVSEKQRMAPLLAASFIGIVRMNPTQKSATPIKGIELALKRCLEDFELSCGDRGVWYGTRKLIQKLQEKMLVARSEKKRSALRAKMRREMNNARRAFEVWRLKPANAERVAHIKYVKEFFLAAVSERAREQLVRQRCKEAAERAGRLLPRNIPGNSSNVGEPQKEAQVQTPAPDHSAAACLT